MSCPGHCWVRSYINGQFVWICLNCPETRPA